jgi:hypothetical protein
MLRRRLFDSIFGRAKPKAEKGKLEKSKPDVRELTYQHIWSQLVDTGATRHPTDLERPNVLVLQMAKVASQSIRSALSSREINVFHCHGLSNARQDRDLDRLRRSDLSVNLVSQRLGQHFQYICLYLLVRWYREYKTRHGRRLKVITLTRDPVNRYASNFMQHRGVARPHILSWQHARLGTDPAEPIDETVAIRDFVTELASIIVEARPSTGADGCQACEALARKRWPNHYIVEEEMSEWLRPLTWFDTEVKSVFGIDALAAPELHERGWVELHSDWAEILVLKFEELAAVLPEIERFMNVPGLTLPFKNATKNKDRAAETIAAINAALDTPVGRACVHELRESRYARACRYDSPGSTSNLEQT